MRHFAFLSDDERAELFHLEPTEIGHGAPLQLLALALGATLYTPATRPDLAETISKQAARGVVSMVLDLEDAVADDQVEAGHDNLTATLREVASWDAAERPMLFARVRAPHQIRRIAGDLDAAADALTGFVLPKFGEATGAAFLDEIAELPRPMLAMPVLETREVIFQETRRESLLAIRRLLDKHRERVLAVRIGATDLCGLYGIRRDRDLTIYDLRFLGDAIGDIVNIFARADDTGFTVTGPVWEYFSNHERLLKPQLRATPFERQHSLRLRQRLVTRDMDGLIREVLLDKANGLCGKTVIHPTHVAVVHALSVVTHEEYTDACAIVAGGPQGGVRASEYGNKMNELKPHRAWAERTMARAAVFGVASEDASFVDLLAASLAA